MKILEPKVSILLKYHNSINTGDKIPISNDIKNELDILKIFYSENYRSMFPTSYDKELIEYNVWKAQKYLKNNFTLKKINTLDDEKKDDLEKMKDSNIWDAAKSFINYYKIVNKINPLDLEVYLDKNLADTYGYILAYYPILHIGNDDTILEPYFKDININPYNSFNSDTTYVHEIMHTQMERKSYTYDNILHRELISCLIELIYACDDCNTVTLKSNELSTIKTLLMCYNNVNTNQAYNMYFYSMLMALKLFSIYYQSNRSGKVEMKSYIQGIINGRATIEDMLDYYNLSIDKNNTANLLRCLSIEVVR